MPLRKTLRDFQIRFSGKEVHPKPLPGASDLAAPNDSQISDCAPPSSSQNSSLPDLRHKDNDISTAGRSSFTVGASPAFSQTSVTAQLQTSLQDSIPLAVPGDLWGRAYEQLKAQDPRLIRQFERCLSGTPRFSTSTTTLATVGTAQRQIQMKVLLDEKIKVDEEAVWKLRVGDSHIIIRDQLDKVVKVIAAAKDFVSTAIASEPHAALVWTGICTLLPLLLIPSEQREANTAGLAEIADIVQHYNVVEMLHRQNTVCQADDRSKLDLETKIVGLYTLILEYQARTIRQLSANVMVKNYGKNKATWNDLLSSIRKAHLLCKERLDILDEYQLQQTLGAQQTRIDLLQSELLQRLDHLQCTEDETLRVVRGQERLDRKEKLESWLRRIDQRDVQAARQTKREPETGLWFLEGRSFGEWLNGTTPFVWLNGDMGCGKSILCSSIVDKLQQTEGQLCTIAYFYFSWDSPDSHDLGIMLKCILAQLASDSRFLAPLDSLREEGEKRVLTRHHMCKTLLDVLSTISSKSAPESLDDSHEAPLIVLVFDALDEVPFGSQRDVVLDFLKTLSTAKPSCLRIIAASRSDIDIETRLVTNGLWKSQQVDTKRIDHDIGLFVKGQLDRHPRLRLQSDKVKSMISEDIMGMANGMFQLASLQMEELQDKNQQTLRPVDVERTLRNLPRGLEESYKRILERIQLQDQLFEECLTALKWLVFSNRPLYIEELVDACVITPSVENTPTGFSTERRLSPIDLVNNLVGLVSVAPYFDRTWTPASRSLYTVSLAHFSVREFLLPSQRKRAGRVDILNDFEPSLVHGFIAKSCLAYIAHCALSKCPMSEDYALRDYAWHWWADHYAASVFEDLVVAIRFALRLFNSVVFPILYEGCERSSDHGTRELRFHRKTLTEFLQPLERDALFKALSDTGFPCGQFDVRQTLLSGPHYVRRPLPEDPRAVRLLVLYPEDSSGLLKASLCMDVLDNKPVYTALSYARQLAFRNAQWYESEILYSFSELYEHQGYYQTSIRIQGKDVHLRPTLVTALEHLRLRKTPRVLWVDALCISSIDSAERFAHGGSMEGIATAERSTHGGSMEDIAKAERSAHGGSMEDIAKASAQMHLMSEIYRSAEEVAAWLGEASSSSGQAMRLLLAVQEPSADEKVSTELAMNSASKQSVNHSGHVLNELFSRPYWRRSWVIQEIVCAKKVTLHCGPHSLDWEDMKSIDSLYNHTAIDSRDRAAAAALQSLRQSYRFGERLGLDHLLFATRHHLCTNLEDRIFSLLSLLSKADAADPLLQVDYMKSWTLIFGLATQFILTKSQDLNILSYAAERRYEYDLPSWVPHWTFVESPPLNARLYRVDEGHGRASQPKSLHSIEFSRPGLVLAVEGIFVDRVEKMIDYLPMLFQMDLNQIKKVPPGQTKIEVCFRTALADCIFGEDKQPERIGKDQFSSPQDWSQAEKIEHLLDSPLLTHLKGRVFFVTCQGYLGSTHSRAREGDLVAILPSAKVPFVLRMVDEGFEEFKAYKLIAQSYVHGIMDGELFDENLGTSLEHETINIV